MPMTPVLLTIAGETRSITAWSKIPGAAKYNTIITRLRKGWPDEAAVFAAPGTRVCSPSDIPVYRKAATLTIAGETHTMLAWSHISGVPYNTIRTRVARGFSASAAVFGDKHSRVRFPRRKVKPSFPIGELPRWGGCHSINFPRVAA